MKRTLAAAIVLTGLATGACGTPPDLADWSGGPVTPSPIEVTVNPSALPVGAPVATALTVEGHEMILYLYGNPVSLMADWRDTSSGKITEEDPVHDGFAGLETVGADPLQVAQYDPDDGSVIEVGYFRGPAARITSQDDGKIVEAKYTRWSQDANVSIFWLRRIGDPYPALKPQSDGSEVPVEAERYPLITAYDQDGMVIGQQRLMPLGRYPN